jgi:hypothetical protein
VHAKLYQNFANPSAIHYQKQLIPRHGIMPLAFKGFDFERHYISHAIQLRGDRQLYQVFFKHRAPATFINASAIAI